MYSAYHPDRARGVFTAAIINLNTPAEDGRRLARLPRMSRELQHAYQSWTRIPIAGRALVAWINAVPRLEPGDLGRLTILVDANNAQGIVGQEYVPNGKTSGKLGPAARLIVGLSLSSSERTKLAERICDANGVPPRIIEPCFNEEEYKELVRREATRDRVLGFAVDSLFCENPIVEGDRTGAYQAGREEAIEQLRPFFASDVLGASAARQVA